MVTVTEQPVGNCEGSQSETAGVIADLVMEAVPPTGSLLVFGRVGQPADFTRAAADSGIGSYRAKVRVNDAAPCESERKSIA